MKDALDEVMSLSDKLFRPLCLRSQHILTGFPRIIRELVDSIVGHIGALYKASEAVSPVWRPSRQFYRRQTQVALLDMLWSFAHASIRKPAILNSHPIPRARPLLLTGALWISLPVFRILVLN